MKRKDEKKDCYFFINVASEKFASHNLHHRCCKELRLVQQEDLPQRHAQKKFQKRISSRFHRGTLVLVCPPVN
jgi:hypothetical protein